MKLISFWKGSSLCREKIRYSKNVFSTFLLVILWLSSTSLLAAEGHSIPDILPLKERADIINRLTQERIEQIIPTMMRREGMDMWILIAREYDEDPVVETMLPADWFSARRRTILVYFDPGLPAEIERLAVSRYNVGELFKTAWNKEEQPDQWERLAEIVASRDPERIGINRSEQFALADGLSSTEHENLIRALPEKYRGRLESAENLAIGWLETRSTLEQQIYPTLCRIAHRIIARGLSEEAIAPGITTTSDLEWWYREKIAELHLSTWFHPSVSLQRRNGTQGEVSYQSRPESRRILPGDLVHVDFGITYLGLTTDTQQHAYILHPNEEDAPPGLREGLKEGNRLQDILISQFTTGKSGNQILQDALRIARSEGLQASIYSHPLGFHGHGAGPTIGLWDQQDEVEGMGDYPLYPDTTYAIELSITRKIPEWGGQEVRIMLEEDAFFDGETVRFINGRQTEFHLVPRSRP